MAKVKAPLFGFSASGKLADSLVYMKWKGINDVRQYVIPANPKTAAQVTQRGYMTSAVTSWHDTPHIAADLTAWNVFATTLAQTMSGFNSFVRKVIDALIDSKTFQTLSNADFASVTATAGTVVMDIAAEGTTTFHWGTSKTVMPSSALGVFDVDHVTFTLAGNTEKTTYYGYAQNAEGTDIGRTGIYKFTTPAA